MSVWPCIERSIQDALGSAFIISNRSTLSGGSINQSYRIDSVSQSFVVKLNTFDQLPMFEAEAAGLAALAAADAIRVPQVICSGQAKNQATDQAVDRTTGQAWLVMEYIELGAGDAASSRLLGQQLAALHACSAEHFGWWRDNTIGSTPQRNGYMDDWPIFFRERRLSVQFELTARNDLSFVLQKKGERLMADLDKFFVSYQPEASLLHGDLWSGNCAFDGQGKPVIFDPAVYYGDRETDLAMTELFGGFSSDFYAAYRQVWPLDAGYMVRKNLYNLYHILNHANLFGGSYITQAESMIDRLLVAL